MQKTIYVDNAATTPVSKEVLNEMLPYFTEYYGNASTLYSLGRQTKLAVDRAREQVANAINAEPSEIYFTAGGRKVTTGLSEVWLCDLDQRVKSTLSHQKSSTRVFCGRSRSWKKRALR